MGHDDAEEIWDLIRRHRAGWPTVSFLKSIPDPALTALVGAARLARFGRDAVLIEEGESTTEVFFLLSSYVKVTARASQTGHALLAIRTGGDVVGEIAATDGGRRLATVRVCGRDPVFAAVLARSDFIRAMGDHPDTLLRLTRAVGGKLRTATRRQVDISDCDPTVRLARVLVELAEDYGQPSPGRRRGIIIQVDITQLEFGTLIGVAQITAHRAMKELRGEGLVDTSYRRLLIPRLAELRKRAGLPPQTVN